MTLYRVFPWDPAATAGAPFSPQHISPSQGSGRFDHPRGAVWYLAESPEHAVAEVLQGFRGRDFQPGMLRRFGHALAICAIELPLDPDSPIVNLDSAEELGQRDLVPSMLASDDRARTQAIAKRIHAEGATGMRWWSRLSGDWHTVVVFLDRDAPSAMTISTPTILDPGNTAVRSACRALGISLAV